MSASRGRKLQQMTTPDTHDVFFMDLSEAKQALMKEYDEFGEKIERRYKRRAKLAS